MKNSVNKLLVGIALFAASVVAPVAQATSYEVIDPSVQFDPTKWVSVDMIGMSPGLAFARFTRGASVIPQDNLPSGVASCLNGLFYLDISQTHGKLIYQQLLLAKSTGKRISRVAFTQDAANGICYMYLTAQVE